MFGTHQLLLAISLTILFRSSSAQISVTTASGTRAPPGPYRSGQLIFQDNFDFLDHETWQHESTMAGGGNSEFQW
jgi:hypothetical protein